MTVDRVREVLERWEWAGFDQRNEGSISVFSNSPLIHHCVLQTPHRIILTPSDNVHSNPIVPVLSRLKKKVRF